MSGTALNPNAQPWLGYQPIIQSPTPVVPYFYSHVAPLYQAFNYYYMVEPVVGQQQPPRGIHQRSRRLKKRPAVNAKLTTVMIRNIPNKFSRYMLVDFLDQLCDDQNVRLKSQTHETPFEYDFLYLPMDFGTGNNLGYAFVNFTNADASQKIWFLLHGYKWGAFVDCNGYKCESPKSCEITWAKIQGKDDLVRHFQKSRFVCNDIEYLPVVFTPPRRGASSLISPATVGNLSGALNSPLPRRRTIPRFSP